ncbi:hypothetical protein FRC15_006086 [Serendipita sp. 397]|nr:hypothetical protein FRC15_006086 [Serendipita sp. 397]KAG8803219.1 hypothetical protein FRC16_006690 [Serendipita sp. 398]
MSLPASATLLRIQDVDSSLVGEKVRVFGYLSLLDDPASSLGVLHSRRWQGSNKGNQRIEDPINVENGASTSSNAILVDISLCRDENSLFRESRTLVMAMGSIIPLESISSRTRRWIKANKKTGLRIEIDPTMTLHAIMLRGAGDIDLQAMEDSIIRRRAYEQSLGDPED